MFWIALCPSREDDFTAWGWRGLCFTPRVARVDEALLLEVAASERLFGGRKALLRQLLEPNEAVEPADAAWGATALIALAKLRLKLRGAPFPPDVPAQLPLDVLSAATDHLPTLERAGLRTWGEIEALPRGAVARRFGKALVDALDAAWGRQPERHAWLQLPEVFDLNIELPELATSAPELMLAAQRLLGRLQLWLQARHRGVLALELEWALDLRRLNGARLPSHEQLVVRTAQPAQDMGHLRRLVHEQLSRASLSAPANHLRLRTLETEPWAAPSRSFLPEDKLQGERLHQLVERLSARLGAGNVVVPLPTADWRPECMQQWVPAIDAPKRPVPCGESSPLYPTWLLPRAVPLEVRDERPWYEGPLRILTRRQRVETAWWEEGGAVVRDYCIARSDKAGLLWIYCEQVAPGKARWWLQGLYA